MKTEKQVEQLLQFENNRVLSCLRDRAQKYMAMYKLSAAGDEYHWMATSALSALRELSDDLGYDWDWDVIGGL